MPIPVPPADASGGYFVVNYTNGSISHRMRVHVLAFNADATGSYVVPPAGGDASVVATYNNLAAVLKLFFTASWTITLQAVFQRQGTNIVEIFSVVAPAGTVGTHAAAGGSLAEAFQCLNFRTSAGGRARVFIYSQEGWSYNAASSVTANAAGTAPQQMVNWATVNTTGVVGHDNHALLAPARDTFGLNKKLRRRVGNA